MLLDKLNAELLHHVSEEQEEVLSGHLLPSAKPFSRSKGRGGVTLLVLSIFIKEVLRIELTSVLPVLRIFVGVIQVGEQPGSFGYVVAANLAVCGGNMWERILR